jgi:ABC-type glycerol-3-phosphate transport system substrate-binding protein
LVQRKTKKEEKMKSLLKILVCVLVCLSVGVVAFAGGQQEAKAEKVKLVIWEWISTQGPGPVYQEILQSYRASHPNVEVESISDPWNQAHDKVLLMHQAGRLPDIIGVNRNWLVEFVALGIIADLTPYVDEVPGMRDKYYDAVKGEIDGKVWILPYDGGNAAFVYNTAKFSQLGLAAPETFDQFMSAARKLADPANNKFATQFCITEKNVTGANVCNIGPILTSFGGTYVKDRKAAFNGPEGVEAFQWMINLEKDGLAAPGGITVDAKNMREAFASERVYTTFDGAWGVTFYNNFPELKWDVSRMLKKKNIGTVVNIMCWGMAKSSKNQEAAWDLLSYIESDDMLLKYFRDGSVMPNTKKHGALPEFQKKYQGFLETYAQTTNYFQTGSVAQESELYRILVEAYHMAFLGQMSVKAALDEAADKYNKSAEEFYAQYK